jgi:hypothetical protein
MINAANHLRVRVGDRRQCLLTGLFLGRAGLGILMWPLGWGLNDKEDGSRR